MLNARHAPHPVPLSAYWFALSVQTSALLVIDLPESLLRLAGSAHVLALARIAALGAVVSMLVPPLIGYLSDRQRQMGARRRSLVVAGTAVNVAGLLGTMEATSVPSLTVFFLIALLGQNGALAAYEAMMPEVVPPSSWGRASGSMGIAMLLGSIVGLGSSGVLGEDWGIAVMAMTVVPAAALTATLREEGLEVPAAAEPPRRRDFGLTFVARFFIMFGLALLMTFVLYFFKDVLGVPNPGVGTALVAGAALLGACGSSLAFGRLADRFPRPKIVAVSGVPMALAAAGFGFFPSERILLPLAVFYGLGYGGFLASDWALALTSLPDRRHTARDLGIWGIASNLPSVLAPAFGGWLLLRYTDPTMGYRMLFLLAGLSFLVGSIVVLGVGKRGLGLGQRAVLLVVALLLLGYVRLVHRFKIVGDGVRRAPSTLFVASHQQDLESMVLPAALYLLGPLRTPVQPVASERMTEPGFLAERAPRWLGWMVNWIPLAPILIWLGILPIENQPRHRPLRSLAAQIQRRDGNVRLDEVFTEATLQEMARRSGRDPRALTLKATWSRPFRPLTGTPVSLAAVRPPYRQEIRGATRERLKGQMDHIAQALASGGSLYLTPEGRVSPDGHLGRFRELLDQLAPLAQEIYAAGVAYDPLRPGRLTLLVGLVKADGRDLRGSVLRARPVTLGQVLAAALLEFEGRPFRASEAVDAACRVLTRIPTEAHLEPSVGRWGRALRRTLAALVRRGMVLEDPSGALRLADERRDGRFPQVADILACQRVMLEDALEAWREAGAGTNRESKPDRPGVLAPYVRRG